VGTALAVLPVTLPAPARAPRRFALTPLADVMFQLLVFFMLSSSLAPYALVPLTAGAGPGAARTAAPEARAPATWHLGAGAVRIGREVVPLDGAAGAVARARAAGVAEVVVFAGAAARAGDVARLLAALQAGGMPRVRLVDGGGAAGGTGADAP